MHLSKGHTEIVKLLLNNPRFNPDDNNNEALLVAAREDHFDVVKLLLNDSRVNPADCENRAIRTDFKNRNTNIIKLLWTDQRVKNTLKNDDIKLYNELTKKDIKKKVIEF